MSPIETLGAAGDGVQLVTIETPGLGNRSYLAIADGWALAVDVQRDLDRVKAALAMADVRLAAVVETHIHNDYVTGGYALARESGARYLVPAGPTLSFDADRAEDGEFFDAGPLRVRVIRSTGHTDSHFSYSLHVGDTPALAAFTGGSLLLGGTGRTDLLGADRAEELARAQYWSARRLTRLLPAGARLLPTHGFGSFCLAGRAVASPGDTLADQFEVNPAFLLDEDDFVAHLLGNLGPYPDYFPKMAPRNLAGPEEADLRPAESVTLSAAAEHAKSAPLVDIRSRAEHARGHVPGSLSIDAAGSLATWTGWVSSIEDPIMLVAETSADVAEAQRELSRIGVDRLVGAYVGRVEENGEVALQTRRLATFGELSEELAHIGPVVDVRDVCEWREGHVQGSVRIAAQDFADGVPIQLRRADTPWLYCGVGFRAAIAASLLARHGRDAVVVNEQLTAAQTAGVPWCDGNTCPTDRCCSPNVPDRVLDTPSGIIATANVH